MSFKNILAVLIATISLLVTSIAQAHTLTVEATSWFAGLIHPLLGSDHLLAIFAIGLWTSQQGGNRLWQLPLASLTMMVIGAMFGYMSWSLPLVEAGIVSSLLVIGLMLTFTVRLSILPSLLMVGIFSLLHGYAHSVEMPQTFAMIDYVLGFVVATNALLGLGVSLGGLALRMQHEILLRFSGLAIGLTGAWSWI
ncbi:hypothetical protein ANRL3_01416 [Anaerolineae bacterium]|nr:hypothetical protein ANRL3_01416 [Anaerolineae bacterium]